MVMKYRNNGALSVATLLAVTTAVAVGACGDNTASTPNAATEPDASGEDGGNATIDLLGYVDPLIGTDDSKSQKPVPGGAGGSTYPGPVVPFGMVQFSPDTPTAEPSGYRDSDRKIEHFSLTHFDGAGCPNNEDIPILPFVGALDASPGGDWASFQSPYKKSSEKASPGYYAIKLDKYDVKAELTATTRTAFARFTYPASDSARVLVHAGRNATGIRAGEIEIDGDHRIKGSALAGGFCGGKTTTFQIYFVAEFDQPFTEVGTWVGKNLSEEKSAKGIGVGSYVTFDTTTNPSVQMKIGISYVSLENAQANLDAENPDFDFDATRAKAETSWNEVLNRVVVTDGSESDLKKFYTALYHVFQSPNVASDVDGRYMGFDRKVHKAEGVRYQNYSGWDIIRSWTHLVAAIAPETPDIIRSMVADGVEGGLLPFWTHQNVETHVMVGDPGTVNVANAYAMGVRGFDTDTALELMDKSADNPSATQRWGLDDWKKLHVVGNAATTLEYAMADFALAQFAHGIGNKDAYEKYLARSDYWRESWNPETGFIAARYGSVQTGDAARIYELEVFGPAATSTNLALHATATASGSCNENEGPAKAVNGSWSGGTSDKWCDNVNVDKWLEVDLGDVKSVDKVVIHHAGAGGESTQWNTKSFTVDLGTDGSAWTTMATVTANKDNVTTHTFTATDARYVRLHIDGTVQSGEPGAWDCEPFEPGSECGFVEGNAAQYVWMVPQNQKALIELMGGNDKANERLDALFEELNAGTDRPYFYIGNEPEHGTPWSYNFMQAPAKTRAIVRRIIDEEFSTNAGGLPGNDDLGATSAWLVWSYLGLYPVIPGTDVLVVHGPLFPSATVRLANGKVVTITADDAKAKSVQTFKVNGKATTKSWIRFSDVAEGGTLDFAIGADSSEWGTGADDVPPSFSP